MQATWRERVSLSVKAVRPTANFITSDLSLRVHCICLNSRALGLPGLPLRPPALLSAMYLRAADR